MATAISLLHGSRSSRGGTSKKNKSPSSSSTKKQLLNKDHQERQTIVAPNILKRIKTSSFAPILASNKSSSPKKRISSPDIQEREQIDGGHEISEMLDITQHPEKSLRHTLAIKSTSPLDYNSTLCSLLQTVAKDKAAAMKQSQTVAPNTIFCTQHQHSIPFDALDPQLDLFTRAMDKDDIDTLMTDFECDTLSSPGDQHNMFSSHYPLEQKNQSQFPKSFF